MYVQIQNEDFGKAVATYGDYVVVANPASVRWSADTASVYHTGSVDYFRYNKNTDSHDYINTFYQNRVDIEVILASESGSNIDTETDIDLIIDQNAYTGSFENGFGHSLDMYEKLLVVGSPYYTQIVQTLTAVITASAASVEIHNLAITELGALTQSTYVTSLNNPVTSVTNSFGQSVSINGSWIAVGSPYIGTAGAVHIYKNTSTGSNYSWALYQTITPLDSIADARFGWDVKLNKDTTAISNSLVVGCGHPVNGQVYYFELVSGSWEQTYRFLPTTDILPLTFGGYMPYTPTMNTSNAFGYAVSTYGNTVVIGAPYDRMVYEYSGSSLYHQGSVYVFEKCTDLPYTQFELVLKTYGTDLTLKNNRLGYSVDVFDGNAIVGIPKINFDSMTSCYIGSTVDQLHQCSGDLENLVHGQAMLLQKNTSSLDWEITNVYQRKKKYLSPYRAFGVDVSTDERSMVVGAPMLLSDTGRQINIRTTQSLDIVLDDICGKSYIYNFANLRHEFHVGNVFYRNGKIILMTSGSSFDGLFFNPINPNTYEYDVSFKGQHTIFEKQIICSINPGEFNVSTNPTAVYTPTASLDINNNGRFDFQDVDVILGYMQYKNTALLGVTISTDWSSSIVKADDEISLLNFCKSQNNYNAEHNAQLTSESIVRWETVDIEMQNILDLNDDNRIDTRDMNTIWKYFSNRLTQENYATYVTPASNIKLFSDIIDYLNFLTQKTTRPLINTGFLDYERSVAFDKTGSFLAPMVTTIGLYSGLDLVCTAKLGSPIKLIPELPFNFVVKMDY